MEKNGSPRGDVARRIRLALLITVVVVVETALVVGTLLLAIYALCAYMLRGS